MKKVLILGFLALSLTACGDANSNVAQQNNTAGANNSSNKSAPKNAADSLVASSHSTDKPVEPKNAPVTSSAPNTQTEGSMAKPVDVTELTADIEKSNKAYKAKSNDATAKEELAKAYFARAYVLTKAAQYRAALGDFRKGLKLNPNDADAKKMHDEILRIFAGMNREPPKEGEEPPPMPFKKEA